MKLRQQFNHYCRSKDEISDAKGPKILEISGSCNGEQNGEYSIIRGTSCSVLDYCFMSGKWNTIFSDFRIAEQTFLDHMPLEISLTASSNVVLIQIKPDVEKRYATLTNDQVDGGSSHITPMEVIGVAMLLIRKPRPHNNKNRLL